MGTSSVIDFGWYYIYLEGYTAKYQNVPDIVCTLVEKGMILPSSPAGCNVYPNPDECVSSGNNEVLRIEVPFELSKGRYIVILVFSYDDKDKKRQLQIRNKDKSLIYNTTTDGEGPNGYISTTQFALPLPVNVTDTMESLKLVIHVYVEESPVHQLDGEDLDGVYLDSPDAFPIVATMTYDAPRRRGGVVYGY